MKGPEKWVENIEEKLNEATKKTSDILDVARGRAVFKAKISEGHRITIPEAERESRQYGGRRSRPSELGKTQGR